ncbi:MAG: ElyC/SanA/YdcF family protein [candidate division KSB1 bacterium]|nr:ElyC/SanA/YdcF family protein [candidate division KSB1 bacterium]
MQWRKRVTRRVWRWPVKLAAAALLALILVLCAKPILVSAGGWLSMPSSEQHCDALILPSGATVSDYFMQEAIRCYQAGQVDRIIVVMHEYDQPSGVFGLENYHDLFMREIQRRDIPDSAVIPLFLKINDPYTYNTARTLTPSLNALGIDSILLLQDNFHIKRSILTYRHVMNAHGIEVEPYVMQIYLNADNWHTSANGWRRVIDEYIKLIVYRIKGYL